MDTVTESDGFQDNRKVKIGFYDSDDDGVVDNPELFDIFVEPDTSVSTKFVFFEKYISYDTIERFRPYAASNFVVTQNETDINLNTTTYTNGQLFYFYADTENVVKKYSSTTNTLTTTTDYYARRGRSSIDLQYKHHAGQDTPLRREEAAQAAEGRRGARQGRRRRHRPNAVSSRSGGSGGMRLPAAPCRRGS